MGYLLLRKKSSTLLIGIVIFCGGFLFHLFWEGKGQYTFPYFVILIPYGLIGIFEIVKFICNTQKQHVNLSAVIFSLFGVLVVIAYVCLGHKCKLTSGDNLYSKYLSDYSIDIYSPVESGQYYFADYSNGLFVSSSQMQYDILEGNDIENAGIYTVNSYGDYVRISEKCSGLFVKRYWYNGIQLLTLIKDGTGKEALWRIYRVEDNVYSILSVDELYAITMDDESLQVIVAPYTGSKNQQWALLRTDF